jgi:hypothetical protein
MNYLWHDIVGNLGVVVIIGTYFCVQVSLMDVKRWTYSLLNAMGSFFIIVSLLFEFNLSAFAVEVAWLLVSCVGLLRLTLESGTVNSKDTRQANG